MFLKALQPLLISSPYTHPALLNQPVFTHVCRGYIYIYMVVISFTINYVHHNYFIQILSRDFQPHKPHPTPIQHICSQWSLSPANVLMVGDDKTDVLSGNAAGTGN